MGNTEKEKIIEKIQELERDIETEFRRIGKVTSQLVSCSNAKIDAMSDEIVCLKQRLKDLP